MPSHCAIERALRQAGLVKARKRRPSYKTTPTHLRDVSGCNEVWAIDYKGQFRLGDRTLCYPLTITDQHSRYILACEGMPAISDEDARDVCGEVFRTWGLPMAIRSDNGVPFSSTGLAGLTKLSAYFLRLGIELERIRPSSPQENSRHERMHRTLKAETTRPARGNLLQQQERFDEWVYEFNHERPHEAIGMRRPAELFGPSTTPMPKTLPDLAYPTHDDVLRVSRTGFIHVATVGSVRLTQALAGHDVGIREQEDGSFLITFANIDLGLVTGKGPLTPTTNNSPESN
jgi:putative transposase